MKKSKPRLDLCCFVLVQDTKISLQIGEGEGGGGFKIGRGAEGLKLGRGMRLVS